MLKICHLCGAYDIPIVPHGHSVPSNVQLSAALSPVEVPYVEFLVKWNEILQYFFKDCLLYTSDAADDLLCVDLGGRRILKKKKK